MEGQEYFKKALADFTFDAACGGEIRHLVDLGYTVKQMMERLSYPVSYGRVQQAVWRYLTDAGILLLAEPGDGAQKEAPVFVKEYDKYGKPSFRQVKENAGRQKVACWKERRFSEKGIGELESFLIRQCKENGERFSYVSCSFGLMEGKCEKMLMELEERQREYIQGIPWERKVAYHRLDQRMREIVVGLYKAGGYHESCYFMKTGEKVLVEG